jgi:hypothetical protein
VGAGAPDLSAALVIGVIAGIGGEGAGLRAIGGDESMQTSAACGSHGPSLAEAHNHAHRGFAVPRGFR